MRFRSPARTVDSTRRSAPPAPSPLMSSRTRVRRVTLTSLAVITAEPASGDEWRVRRACDLILATALGLLLSPLILAVAVAVRWILGGPVLFRQTRSGRAGAEFTILKFRTMRPAARSDEDDAARDTRFGRRLRAASLDELPQLWNVLRGDM